MANTIWFHVPLFLKASKRTSHKVAVMAMARSLCGFLDSNHLSIKPLLNSDGAASEEIVVRDEVLTDLGRLTMEEGFYRWLEFTDRGGDPANISILKNALKKAAGAIHMNSPSIADVNALTGRNSVSRPRTRKAETKKSDVSIYDKAAWHLEGQFPEELDDHQAYVIGGFVLGWLCDRGLLSEETQINFGEDIRQFVKREITGAELYEVMDGTLTNHDVSGAIERFLDTYVGSAGTYLSDYEKTLAGGLRTVYHVQDTWENLATIETVIDRALAAWKQRNSGEPE